MTDLNFTSAMLAMSQSTTHARAQDADSAKALVQPDGNAKDPALWEVSLKFEAMLMQQMMSAMRKTVSQDGLLSSGFANDMYSSMFDQAIAETGSKSGSLGIAENIYRQMNANSQTKANPISADIHTSDQTSRSEE
jgi:flagellar protein FlgJ